VRKTVQTASANLEQSLANIPQRYTDGVKGADWQSKAGSEQAEQNFSSAMQKAIAQKRRQAGVQRVSNADWQNAAATKGGPIIAERIRGSLGKYQANFGPVLDAMNMAAERAPARTTDYRANINNRLVPVVEAAKRQAGKL